MVHHSDSAPGARLKDGAYVTAYPTPDGDYVVARTWPDTQADRPNTVVSRSLLIGRSALSIVSAEALLRHLVRPSVDETRGALAPIDAQLLRADPLCLSDVEANIAALYFTATAPLPKLDERSRERVALAVWELLWTTARAQQYLCTAPGTTRFAKRSGVLLFDKLSGAEDRGPAGQVNSTLASGLAMPGRFHEFVRFVGSGETSTRLMVPFAEAFALIGDSAPSATDFSDSLARCSATEPARLRRLKRRMLVADATVARPKFESLEVVRQLALGQLGEFVFAKDASIGGWLQGSWSADAAETLRVINLAGESGSGALSEEATARESLGASLERELPGLIAPESLEVALELQPTVAIRAIWRRNEPELWRGWARVGRGFASSGPEDSATDFAWSIPLDAVRDDPNSLYKFLRRHHAALEALISLADQDPRQVDLTVHLPREIRRKIARRTETAVTELRGLARLSRPESVAGWLEPEPWLDSLRSSDDDILAVTAYSIARRRPRRLAQVLAHSFARLFDALATKPADEAWQRLAVVTRADVEGWDRCPVLTEDYSKNLRSGTAEDALWALMQVEETSERAADGLREALKHAGQHGKRFHLFDPKTW